MENNWKKKTKSYEEYDKILRESAKGAPSREQEIEEAFKEFEREWDAMSEEEKEGLRQVIAKGDALAKKINEEKQSQQKQTHLGEEILAECERGDFSSLDPELLREIEERERREKDKKVAKPKRKEVSISN